MTYDVCTETKEGRRRLRRVAQTCLDFGQRVQNSVFECAVGNKELVVLRARLRQEIDAKEDSLRIYFLNESDRQRTEHFGVGQPRNLEEPLIL